MGLTKVTYAMIENAPINVLDYGAVGDGVTDDTDAIQAALDAGAASGQWVTGAGNTYAVSTVNMSSGQRVQSLYLQSIGPLTSGAVSFQPVVEIDGTTTAKTDMIFRDVRVNGRRQLFTNINILAGEDGGMHCWRVVATSTGGVSNILWEDCEGTYAGTAGLAIHDATPTVTAINYPIKNLIWKGGKLTYNREHGFFADSFNGLQVIDCDCQYNGIDLNTSDPLESGNRGARSGGYLFGASFDIETYTGYNGSLWTQFYARNLNCQNSAMPSLIYNPIATDVTGYSAPRNTKIVDCTFDGGSATGADRAPDTDYSFKAQGNYTSTGPSFVGMAFSNNRFLQRQLVFAGISELTVDGGFIECVDYKASVVNCQTWQISCASEPDAIYVFPLIDFVFTKTGGPSGASIVVEGVEYVASDTGGRLVVRSIVQIGGAVSGSGDVVYTTVSPIDGMIITAGYASAVCGTTLSAGQAIANSLLVEDGVATFNANTSLSNNIFAQIVLTLSPAG